MEKERSLICTKSVRKFNGYCFKSMILQMTYKIVTLKSYTTKFLKVAKKWIEKDSYYFWTFYQWFNKLLGYP